jgi:hypothetical protein
MRAVRERVAVLPTPEDIDALLAHEKRLAGQPAWSRSRETTIRIRVPLRIGDAIVGGLFLAGTASIHNRTQDGSLLLLYGGQVIERMSVFPTGPHPNPLDKRLPPEIRGLTLPASCHRFHAWNRNRRWPRPKGDNLSVAEPIDVRLATFADAIHYFMRRTRIVGALPAPRHEPRLPL